MKRLIWIFMMVMAFGWGCELASGQEQKHTINLLSLHEGTLPVLEPAAYSGWPVAALLDDSPETGWACETGNTKGNVFVFEMIAPAVVERFEFDNAHVDDDGASAKDISVEVSATSMKTGFETVLKATLKDSTDRQGFKAAKAVNGRWLRLTIHANYGSESWTELLSFRGYGSMPPAGAPLENISGTYDSSYSKFHVRQQGTALVGCYEFDNGLLNGAIEGRLMKIAWQEAGGNKQGLAVMVFAPDGKGFRGYWWTSGKEKGAPDGDWEGKKLSSEVGGCPHWSGSLSGGSHNLTLSQQRADSVKAYLVAGGIDSGGLKTKGFGAGKPVADNASELGRAQNRRVELVRE
ncbi:MAG: OmpA family protein [Candidatus Aminicenantes bacterium]|nr:OmpA family protein [Candidatus Aminicenantes bacterium]